MRLVAECGSPRSGFVIGHYACHLCHSVHLFICSSVCVLMCGTLEYLMRTDSDWESVCISMRKDESDCVLPLHGDLSNLVTIKHVTLG